MSLVTRDHFRLKVLWGVMTPGRLLFMSTSLSLALSLPCEVWGYSMVGGLDFFRNRTWPNKQRYHYNKTISDGGITVDFSILKVHTSN